LGDSEGLFRESDLASETPSVVAIVVGPLAVIGIDQTTVRVDVAGWVSGSPTAVGRLVSVDPLEGGSRLEQTGPERLAIGLLGMADSGHFAVLERRIDTGQGGVGESVSALLVSREPVVGALGEQEAIALVDDRLVPAGWAISAATNWDWGGRRSWDGWLSGLWGSCTGDSAEVYVDEVEVIGVIVPESVPREESVDAWIVDGELALGVEVGVRQWSSVHPGPRVRRVAPQKTDPSGFR